MESIWSRVKSELQTNVPGHSYRMWIEPLECCWAEEDDRVTLNCPNLFFRNRVQETYSKMLETAINRISGRECQLSFQVTASDAQTELPTVNNTGRSLPQPRARTRQQDLPSLSQRP